MVKKRINFAGSSTLILKDKSTLTEVIVTAILKPHNVRLAHPYYCLEIKGIASHRTYFMETNKQTQKNQLQFGQQRGLNLHRVSANFDASFHTHRSP